MKSNHLLVARDSLFNKGLYVRLLAGLIGLLVLIALYSGLSVWLRPSSSLTADLPGEWDKASTTFDMRVKARFPVGSPESAMITALRDQDFKWARNYGLNRKAVRDESNFACNVEAQIFWNADKNGMIVTIFGRYENLGCL